MQKEKGSVQFKTMSAEDKKPARPLSDYKKQISQGIWFFLHTMAEAAREDWQMKAYAYYFRNVCDKMGCSCENHCKVMLQNHPPERYFHMKDKKGIPNGCLYHSIKCHNLVNERLGKPVYTYDDIAPLYRGNGAETPCNAPETTEASSRSAAPQSIPGLEEIAKRHPNLIIRKTAEPIRLEASRRKSKQEGFKVVGV